MRSKLLTGAVALGAAGLLAVPATAGAHDGGRTEVVEAQDDCDPASFDAAVGPGTCIGDGDTTFDEFVEELLDDGEHGKWRFHPDRTTIRRGDSLRVTGVGGEFHTFTEVQRFGGGCVEEVNELLGLTPIAECEDLVEVEEGVFVPRGFVETGVPPGGHHVVEDLAPGVHKFECLIHPWMQATVTVRR
jgi:plastocyanin